MVDENSPVEYVAPFPFSGPDGAGSGMLKEAYTLHRGGFFDAIKTETRNPNVAYVGFFGVPNLAKNNSRLLRFHMLQRVLQFDAPASWDDPEYRNGIREDSRIDIVNYHIPNDAHIGDTTVHCEMKKNWKRDQEKLELTFRSKHVRDIKVINSRYEYWFKEVTAEAPEDYTPIKDGAHVHTWYIVLAKRKPGK